MNAWLISAALLLVAMGVIHSLLGERLIFRASRSVAGARERGGWGRYTGIVRATWHLVSLLGWWIAAVLAHAAQAPAGAVLPGWSAGLLVAATVFGGLLVAAQTQGRHPGWVGLLTAGALVAAGTWA